MRVLVIPDCHLKPWMFEDATAIMNSGKADNAVCLMDIPDDFGKDDPDLYKKAYDAAIRFAERFPQSLWCYGNHDLSYVWNKPETGFNPAVRMLVREKLEELERTLSSPSQLAYMPIWSANAMRQMSMPPASVIRAASFSWLSIRTNLLQMY